MQFILNEQVWLYPNDIWTEKIILALIWAF